MCPTEVHHLLINTSCQVQRLALVNMPLAAVTGPLRGACRLISSREGGGTGTGRRGRVFFGVLRGGVSRRGDMSDAPRELPGRTQLGVR